MEFGWSAEQEQLRQMARAFAARVLAPGYRRGDVQGLSRETVKAMGDVGFLGLRIRAEYGGAQQDCVASGIVIEELARGDFNYALLIGTSGLAAEILQGCAPEPVKAEWLPAVASGDRIVALAVTEPDAGSDAGAMRSTAVRRDGGYVLSGAKAGISLALAAEGFIIFAKTDPSRGARGVSGFLVPRSAPGLTVQPLADMGGHALARGMVYLEEVQVPESSRLGEENSGFRAVMAAFDFSRILIGLAALGAARATLDETIRHVQERRAFGRPLGSFQGVSFRIAEMETKLEAARWLCYRALWLRDQGLPHTKEAAMVKWYAPRLAVEMIHDCLLLHGQYGYTRDLPVEQRLRDVIGLEIGDGTAEIQKLVIVREVMGREFIT